MACLLALPGELSLQIIKLLRIGDQKNLSATCKSYRAQLLPEIFNTIRFTNNETSATSALTAVETYGQYTKAIEFICPCDHGDATTQFSLLTVPSLLPAASKVLKGHFTPDLQMVRLKFDFHFDGGGDNRVQLYFELPEDADATREEELHNKWRALINETWEALVINTFVRELILDELPLKWTSTYYTNAFHQFLNQLESATFNLFGAEDPPGWRTNTTQGCIEFLSSLDALFFRHMRGLKHLHIQASDPLGLARKLHEFSIPLPFKPEDIPLLQSLKLENCFISTELVSFIQDHAQVLKSLDINECFGTWLPDEDGYLCWAEFFDEVYKAKPRLTELLAGGNKAPFLLDEAFGWVEDHVQPVRQKLEADPTLKVFRHAYLEDKDGKLCADVEGNMVRFDRGDDQRAYNRLMELVNGNRA